MSSNTNSLVSNFSNLFSLSNPNTVKTPTPSKTQKSPTPNTIQPTSIIDSIKSTVENTFSQNSNKSPTLTSSQKNTTQPLSNNVVSKSQTQQSTTSSVKSQTPQQTPQQTPSPQTAQQTPQQTAPQTVQQTAPQTSAVSFDGNSIPSTTFIKDNNEITISVNNTLWRNLINLSILIFTVRNFMIFTICAILLFLSYNVFLYNVEKTDFFNKHLGKGVVEIFKDLKAIISNTIFGLETATDTVTQSIGLSNKRSKVVSHDQEENNSDTKEKKTIEKKSKTKQLENKINEPNYESIYEKEIKSFEKALGDFDSPNKKGWCYVGSDRGYRSCVKVSEQDACLSKDIYPRKDLCENPTLRI
jgi:hypothetical protein